MAGKYTSGSQQRILRVVLALFGDVVRGYQPSALAKLVGCNPSDITRDLDNLETAGIAAYDEQTQCWRLTSRLPQQAVKVYAALGRAEVQLREDRERYTSPARASDGEVLNFLFNGDRK
tara:strand:+ start:4038 stop:4394 length:357 start_codon:yes stop_codon:yes gene_type:complete